MQLASKHKKTYAARESFSFHIINMAENNDDVVEKKIVLQLEFLGLICLN